MDIIKRKILLEDSTFRGYDENIKWGTMTAQTFYIKIRLTQNIDDMGLFTDIEYISKSDLATSKPDYTILKNKIGSSYHYPFMSNTLPMNINRVNSNSTEDITLRFIDNSETTYYDYGNNIITGATDSKITDVQTYPTLLNPSLYRAGFDVAKEGYINYKGVSVSGVNRVQIYGEPTIYVFDAITGSTLGQDNQPHGLQYADYTGKTRTQVINGDTNPLPLTTFRYIGEGLNSTNVSLSALTKEEYLFGIISRPEVENDVFIDRGSTSVLDSHLRLSEINNLGQLTNYGNGFYKINKKN
jgi:hypothetical protein